MKKLNFSVPSTLGLIVDVLLIVQLAINLYRTFKPKTKETEPSHDNE
jgi:hypothetical protein